jgi:elongation factor 2
MVKFNIEEMKNLMYEQSQIRNLTIIAHVDHGKSTLVDSLLAKSGFLAQHKAGEERGLDIGELEKLKGITIKSTGVS